MPAMAPDQALKQHGQCADGPRQPLRREPRRRVGRRGARETARARPQDLVCEPGRGAAPARGTWRVRLVRSEGRGVSD